MSRQFNFYAHLTDLPAIEQILRETLGEYLTTENVRGSASSLAPQPIPIPQACEKSGIRVPFGRAFLIVPPWAATRVHPIPTNRVDAPGELIVQTHDNPVLEYECSYFDSATSIVHCGRFYWSYLGRLSDSQLKSVERLFRALRAASEPLEGSNFLRVFPGARELAHGFVLNIGANPVPSPYQ